MALLLSLETSTTGCSAALHNNGKLMMAEELRIPQTAASRLAVMVNDIFTQTKIKQSDLDGVVVSKGPGSYTGLRIGVATAKGLCYALGKPMIVINSLELLAYEAFLQKPFAALPKTQPFLYCPMLDARRMEVYCMLLDADRNIINDSEAKIIDEHSFGERLQNDVIYFFGDGAEKCREKIVHPHAIFIPEIHPTAHHLGEMGHLRWLTGIFENLATFEPFYLKDFLIRKPNSL